MYGLGRAHDPCIEGQDVADGGNCDGHYHMCIGLGHSLSYAVHEAGLLPGRNHDEHIINTNTC